MRSRFGGTRKIIFAGKISRIAFFGLIGFIVFVFFYTIWVSRDLPTPGKLSNPDLKDSTRILDKEGVLLFSFYKDFNRIYVSLDEIPEDLKNATIATEDKDFYKNRGFSLFAYGRVFKDLILYQRLTGGSTITQQLVKNVLLSPERRITRKIKELILAVQVDGRFTKNEIIEMYLNNVSYGGTAVGVEAASNLYFDKSVEELTLEESVFLAGLPQAPSLYSPFNGEAYISRTKHVLDRMEDEGYISKDEEEDALKKVKKFKFKKNAENIKAPHFVMYVRQQLIDMFGEGLVENGNLEVTTTLDYEIQEKAEDIIDKEFEKLEGYEVNNGAAIVLDVKTGGILSMVGSKDFFDTDNDGNFNASLGFRQPGSALKPIMYAVAFEKGYTPATLIMDVRTEFPVIDPDDPIYAPVNYDGEYIGPIQIRFALGNSINVPAVKMLARVGIKSVMEQAYDMGIKNWEPTKKNLENVGLSLVLGGRETTLLDMVTAYSVFAREGIKKEPFSIMEVKDRKGKVLFEHKDRKGNRVLSKEVSFLISHILYDNNAREAVFGTNSYLVIPGRTVAAKTGTTDEKRDNWAIGYTPSFVVGVWVGNNDNSPLDRRIASGATGASPIFRNIIIETLRGTKSEDFDQPDGVISAQIDAFSGGLTREGQSQRVEFFVKGTQPTTVSPIYKTLKLSKKDQGRLASDEEIARADYDTGEFIIFEEDDPVSDDGINRWQQAIDAWVAARYEDDPRYRPPTEKSDFTYPEETPTPTPTEPEPTSTVTPSP